MREDTTLAAMNAARRIRAEIHSLAEHVGWKAGTGPDTQTAIALDETIKELGSIAGRVYELVCTRVAELREKATDEEEFGANVWVYCDQHLDVHRTGWCTAPVAHKTVLAATDMDSAIAECRDRDIGSMTDVECPRCARPAIWMPGKGIQCSYCSAVARRPGGHEN